MKPGDRVRVALGYINEWGLVTGTIEALYSPTMVVVDWDKPFFDGPSPIFYVGSLEPHDDKGMIDIFKEILRA